VTLLDDWRPTTSPRTASAICPSCGGREGSDPSAMLGLVLVLVANMAVIAALVTAVVLILT
jgi:hypothetical protein